MATSSRTTVQSQIPHTALTALDCYLIHARAERTNDVPTILPTVSEWDQHFALLSSTPDGELALRLAVNADEVEEFYHDRVKNWLVINSYGENDVYSNWFKLTDTRGKLQMVESGNVIQNHVAVLFPSWTDGILGEIMWTEPAWSNKSIDPERMAAISRQIDAYDEATRAQDSAAKLEFIEPTTCSVLRTVEVGGDRRQRLVARSKDELAAAWAATGRIVEHRRLTRTTTNTYVFASYKMTVEYDDRTVERETATIHPLGPNDKFIGELSYSLEVPI